MPSYPPGFDYDYEQTHSQSADLAQAKLFAPGIAKMVAYLKALAAPDRSDRRDITTSAPKAVTIDFQQITANAAQQLNRVQQQADGGWFSAYITFSAASGAGKYTLNGVAPTSTLGLDIPAGFFQLSIEGVDNLRNFQVIATSATDVRMTYTLFQ